MDWLLYIIIIALAAFCFYMKFIDPIQSKKKKKKPEETTVTTTKRTDYSNCYQPKYLLTKNEWYAHKKLRELADQKGMIICPKVRLLDIIEPRKGEKDYKALFYKIQAKHVDFVICDSSMKILAVLELDDSSHDQKDRQNRDQFVDEILESVGYKVIRTKYVNDNTLDALVVEQPTE